MPPRFEPRRREEPNRWSRWLAAHSTRSVVLVSVLLGCAVAALPWGHWWTRLLMGLVVGITPYNGVMMARNRLALWKKQHPDSN
jgi:ABC-type transport system involved in cytochrome c biogenesis permease subunit